MGEMLGNGFVRWKGEDVSKTLGVGNADGTNDRGCIRSCQPSLALYFDKWR